MNKYNWEIYSQKLVLARKIVRIIKGEPKSSHEIANEYNLVGQIARMLYEN